MLRLLPGISSLPVSTLPVHSSAFFPNLSRVFFCVLTLANTGSCVGPQNKIGHLADVTFDADSHVECPRNINRLQNLLCYCFSEFVVQNYEYNLSRGLRKRDLWYNDLWDE